jgi:dTMP kinase
MAPETEALLFLASRAQLVRESLGPAVARGELVVCDRYADSTLAYQGYGRGLDLEELRRLNDLATGGVYPQLTVLLDLPVEGGSRRLAGRTLDRIEGGETGEHQAQWAFHTRVREGYLALAREEPQRWLVLDASLSRREVGAAVWDGVWELLERRP